MPKLRKHLSYANVVATLTLFLVLGSGAAYAASHLARNSVGARQLRKNAVTGAKVKNQSLTGADVKASTLGEVPAAKNAETAKSAGSAAPTGPAGGALTGSYPNPQIADHAITAAMLPGGVLRDVHVIESKPATSTAGYEYGEAKCPAGEKAIGGGAIPFGAITEKVALSVSGPLDSIHPGIQGWYAQAIEVNGGTTNFWSLETYAICAAL
jgi:hypothetical protein